MQYTVVVIQMPKTALEIEQAITNAQPGGFKLVSATADKQRLILVYGQ